MADAWTGSSARLQRYLIAGEDQASLSDAEQEFVDELLDFRKMNEIRARVDELVEDPATAELLKPWYRYMCKRPGFSDEYLQTFNRPTVHLVDTADHGGVSRMTEHAVVVGDREYEVDCVIFATGFEVGRSGILTGRLPVYGRGGQTLREYWGRGPRTLHGFYSHGFPSLFHLGPLQNASSVNFTHILDEQATHVAEVIAEARKRGAKYVEPSEAAEAEWVDRIHSYGSERYKFLAECTPGYYNNEGKPRERNESFGDGALAFHDLLRRWRAEGGMDDVLVSG